MSKTVTYLYPIVSKASHLKIFQDRTSQVRAFYFTRENIREIERQESSRNYSVYFLFDDSDESANQVYVGQSMNGIGRISEHVRNKDFWSYCLMFVTDNNSFDKMAIDYLEYEFIKKLKKSSYLLENHDLRMTEPNISIYDKPNLNAYIEQIEFLLNAEGVVLDEIQETTIHNEKLYKPKSAKYNASILIKDGQFILVKGSELKRPIESSRNWSDEGRFYHRQNKTMDGYLRDEKVEKMDDKYIAKVNLAFKSPSTVASLISGRAENGWKFFEGLEEQRKTQRNDES